MHINSRKKWLILSLGGEGRQGPGQVTYPFLRMFLPTSIMQPGTGGRSLDQWPEERGRQFRQSFCRKRWRAWNPLVFQFVWTSAVSRAARREGCTWEPNVATRCFNSKQAFVFKLFTGFFLQLTPPPYLFQYQNGNRPMNQPDALLAEKFQGTAYGQKFRQ